MKITTDGRPLIMRLRKKHGWLAASALIIMLVVWFFWPSSQWSFRRALPRTAQDVHEWYWEDRFLPDYSYHLKAKITPDEFQRYVQRLGLTLHTPVRQYQDDMHWLSWQSAPGFTNRWWDVSDSLVGTYVEQGHDTWSFAKYERGYVYVSSLNH